MHAKIDRQCAIDATAWFSVLARAMSRPDQREATQARQALKELGVRVQFSRDRQTRRAGMTSV